MADLIAEHRYGRRPGFTLGVEEELLLVDPQTHRLTHVASTILRELGAEDSGSSVHLDAGVAKPDTYEAQVELSSPVCMNADEAGRSLAGLRSAAAAAGATLLGTGIHPDSEFGDVVHIPAARYIDIAESMRGLLRRTPTCALHVHVGMPDPETAMRAYNGLRNHLPLLQALSANSPFWFGMDSGLASARAPLFRGFPRAQIPRAFASYDDYAETVAAVLLAGGLPDYTFLWWDLRPHPAHGTVEVRAMDGQSDLESAVALSALVHGLAIHESQQPAAARPAPSEAISESSFRAARDGATATILHDGELQPVAEVARDAVTLARAALAGVGGESALDGIERLVADGGGAGIQRAAHERGGMPGLLEDQVARTARGL
jgi:glutamate---cysteine ligase / carboxylate-amine ligase